MTPERQAARALRRLIADAYLTDDPPPGTHRATWFITALAREPDDPAHHAMARDFLAVLDLYRRLAEALAATDDPQTGLILHGLIGHATAELMGATRDPGWRAAALDLLEPDGRTEPPIDRADAVRLFALALGLDPEPTDAPD